MNNKHKYIRLVPVAFISAMFLLSCGSSSDKGKTPAAGASETAEKEEVADSGAIVSLTGEQFKQADIQLGNLEKKPLSAFLSVNGMVDIPPQSKISVSFPYGGFVRSIKVLEGDYVKKGSLLAVLENPEYVDLQESYLKNKSALEYAQKEYDRQKELYQADVAAGKSYQKATSEYHSLQATVDAMDQKLRLLGISPNSLAPGSIRSSANIYAPASGYITKVSANQGKYIDAQQELLELDDTQNVHIDLTIYEKDAGMIKEGQKVLFTLADDKQQEEARIELVGREIREDRSVLVHALPNDKNKYYMPGTYVQASVQLDNVTSEVLPSEAVVRTGGQQYVFIKKGMGKDSSYTFQMFPVSVGAEAGGYIQAQLPQGINVPDSSIVTKGAFSLLSVLKNSGEAED